MSRELRKVEMAEALARLLWPTFARERTCLYRHLMTLPTEEVKRRLMIAAFVPQDLPLTWGQP